MPSTLNADNGVSSGSAGLKSSADSSGILALQTNGTTAVSIGTDQSVSIPKGVGGTPAFSAYQSSSQSLSAATYTKLNFQTEEYDTNSNFASSRFTPTVSGYYLFTGAFEIGTTQATLLVTLYKNGSLSKMLQYTAGVGNAANGSATIYMNGSTDYVELYGYSSLANSVVASASSTYFQGSLVRAA